MVVREDSVRDMQSDMWPVTLQRYRTAHPCALGPGDGHVVHFKLPRRAGNGTATVLAVNDHISRWALALKDRARAYVLQREDACKSQYYTRKETYGPGYALHSPW